LNVISIGEKRGDWKEETHKRKRTAFFHPLPQQIQLNLPRHTHMPSITPDPIRPINMSAAFHSLTFQDSARSTQHALIAPHAPALPLSISHNKPQSFLSCTLRYTKPAGWLAQQSFFVLHWWFPCGSGFFVGFFLLVFFICLLLVWGFLEGVLGFLGGIFCLFGFSCCFFTKPGNHRMQNMALYIQKRGKRVKQGSIAPLGSYHTCK